MDYDTNEIVFSAEPDRQRDFAPGRYVRIYNNKRSAMFGITGIRRDGDRYVVTLDKNALMAQFPVAGLDDGRITVGATTPFVGGAAEKDGKLTDAAGNYYHGCRVGRGKAARLVDGITGSHIYLAKPAAKGRLEKDYGGKVVSVWHYGVGDRVEAARVDSKQRAATAP